jgi:PHP family Zn ribbon phosphoesterase
MIPPLIVRTCLEQQIDIIAITDHNTTRNIVSVQKAAQSTPLLVLPGMEIQTVEEVHLLCIFPSMDAAEVWQVIVDKELPDIPNDADHFGEQYIVDETGDFIRNEPKLLINSTHLNIEEIVRQVHQLGGLVIPAHVDRKAYGMIANLGFIPPDLPFDAIEISRNIELEKAQEQIRFINNFPIIKGGDAHRLNELVGFNSFLLDHPSFNEVKKAFKSDEGRSFKVDNLQPIR